ncbi:MAG: hypothetical protein HYU53_19030 [Acidobacteria bacterium]|nr:hypothetical protein [Acidobacteriota bacterium]
MPFRGVLSLALILRGALLHTDIALLAPSRACLFLGPGSAYTSVTLALDGERRDAETVTGHWAFARTLLGEVKPNPSKDDVVRRWYVAVAAYLELHALLGIASPHLARAQQVLGDDPDICRPRRELHRNRSRTRLPDRAHGASAGRGVFLARRRCARGRARHAGRSSGPRFAPSMD